MALVILNQFDGGQAQDVRDFSTNKQETSYNFDIFTTPHYLRPYIDMVAETTVSGTITDYDITDVDSIIVSGTPTYVALGRTSSGFSTPRFFKKDSTSDITSGWQLYASGVNIKVANSLVVYKGFAYCLGDTSSAYTLQKYDGASTVTTIGTTTGYNSAGVVPRPFVHPEDNVLYIGAGNVISSYDGSTFTATAFTLPDDKIIVSITSYGGYLAIACRPKNGVGNSVCYLWGRDTTLNTVQASIDLGAGQVNIVENLYNNLFFVISESSVGNYSNVVNNSMAIKGYAGGAVETIFEFQLSSSFGTALNNQKRKQNDFLYFGFTNDTAIYRFGKNKDGQYTLSHDRAYPSGATTIRGFSLSGDVMWLSFDTSGSSSLLYRTRVASESQAYTTTSTYVTTINPSMPIEDRYRHKQLQAVSISFTGGTAVNLKVSVDGGSYTTIISSSATGEQVVEATNFNDSTPLPDGRELQFKIESTGNAKIKEVRYRYDVLETQNI